MRKQTGWLAMLLVAGMALAPSTGRAQTNVLDYDVPRDPHPFPLPLYHDRPETGGLFVAGEFIYWKQTNPLGNQVIATYAEADAPIVALRASADDQETFVPGWHVALGYRFRNGLVAQVDWYKLHDAVVTSGATLVQNGNFQPPVINFLFSPVFNFPTDFVGNEADGIWQNADEMTIKWIQRFDRWDLAFRVPVCETEYSRTYALTGFHHVWMWERFGWRTVDRADDGNADPQDVAEYSSILSQPMYGVYCGCGQECFFGQDCKSFGLTFDVRAAVMVDFVRNLVKYERADEAVGSKRNRRLYRTVGELEAQINLWWYPIEGVVCRVGYDCMAFFNTAHIPNPVDFNYLGLSPQIETRALRLIDGLNLGIGFIF
jgi:hypothetical protein